MTPMRHIRAAHNGAIHRADTLSRRGSDMCYYVSRLKKHINSPVKDAQEQVDGVAQ